MSDFIKIPGHNAWVNLDRIDNIRLAEYEFTDKCSLFFFSLNQDKQSYNYPSKAAAIDAIAKMIGGGDE